MNFSIYISDEMEKKLDSVASNFGKKRNAVIREALEEWIARHDNSGWPKSVLDYKGTQNSIDFESYRNEMKEPEGDVF